MNRLTRGRSFRKQTNELKRRELSRFMNCGHGSACFGKRTNKREFICERLQHERSMKSSLCAQVQPTRPFRPCSALGHNHRITPDS